MEQPPILQALDAAVGLKPIHKLHWPPHRNVGTPKTPKLRLSRYRVQRIGRRLTTAEWFWRCFIQGQPA